MIIKTFVNGPLSVNTYLVRKDSVTIAIDPGHDMSEVLLYLSEEGVNLDLILLTHGHIDHVAGVATLKEAFPDAPVWIHKGDVGMAKDLPMQSRMLGMATVPSFEIDRILDKEDKLEFNGVEFELIYISGHSEGSICYRFDEHIFSGDTLFNFSVGRTDLMGSTTHQELIGNIKKKLYDPFEESYLVYPGHGPATTIGFEKSNNIMVR